MWRLLGVEGVGGEGRGRGAAVVIVSGGRDVEGVWCDGHMGERTANCTHRHDI